MAVNDAYIIDAMAIDKNTNTLVLLIIDPYTWAVQELDHLKAIQKKINTYVSYITKKGYRSQYGDNTDFDGFRIELKCKYQYTRRGTAVFEAGKKQLKERNIDFVYSVEDTSKNETAKEEN